MKSMQDNTAVIPAHQAYEFIAWAKNILRDRKADWADLEEIEGQASEWRTRVGYEDIGRELTQIQRRAEARLDAAFD